MPSWKKVITSGSNAVLNQITASGDVRLSNGDLRLPNGNRIYYSLNSDANYLDFQSGRLIMGYTTNGFRFDMNGSSVKTIEMLGNSDFKILGRNNKKIILEPQGTGVVEVLGTISGSSTSTGSFGAGYIDNKLGIGTTSPADSIDIQQTDSVIRFKNTGASNWEGIELYNPSDSSFVAGFGSYANTSNGYIRDSGGNIAVFNSSTWTFNRVVRMSDGSGKYGFHHQNNTYRTGFGGILGSAAQATIHISGSGNNIGLYSEGFISGSSTSTGSFGAGYIDNKLGIGTTSPDEGLHLKSKNILFERAGYDTVSMVVLVIIYF